MNPKQLKQMGIPNGPAMGAAVAAIKRLVAQPEPVDLQALLRQVIEQPQAFVGHPVLGLLAGELQRNLAADPRVCGEAASAPWVRYGDDLDQGSLDQMTAAARLPVAVRGALMPDAHTGYGLPIGGVLATDGAVIPYAVGVDIACRMKLSVLDLPLGYLDSRQDRLARAIEAETRFGVGASFSPGELREHQVMDDDWGVTEVTRSQRDKAARQLGSSGSGNHFAEFGVLELAQDDLGLPAGKHLALLSHSGSRAAGMAVANHYSKLAMDLRPTLPRELRHLAWLDFDSPEGQEYWAAMELMGRYASANHALIHRHVAAHLGAQVLAQVENHHNFAWKEQHDGREVVVHRKGATPAGEGALGVIPGSMATPGFVVRGKGAAASLNSASHGAGRRMSRSAAFRRLDWPDARRFLAQRNVTLLSGGLDEVPMAYKDIRQVMAAQRELVEVVATFHPRLVKMAPSQPRKRHRSKGGKGGKRRR